MGNNLKYYQKRKDIGKNKNDNIYKDLTVKGFSFKLFILYYGITD